RVLQRRERYRDYFRFSAPVFGEMFAARPQPVTDGPMPDLFPSDDALLAIRTKAPGPAGQLPLTEEMLKERPSGDLFGWSQNAGMGWRAEEMTRPPFLILSTQEIGRAHV